MSANVYLIHGDTPSVILRAQQNIADEIITEMDGSTLVIKTKNKLRKPKHLKFLVQIKECIGQTNLCPYSKGIYHEIASIFYPK